MPKYLPTCITRDRLVTLLDEGINHATIYLLLCSKGLHLEDGCECSTRRICDWVGELRGRRAKWETVQGALLALVGSGLLARRRLSGSVVVYTVPPVSRQGGNRGNGGNSDTGYDDSGYGGRTQVTRGAPSTSERREEKGKDDTSSYPPPAESSGNGSAPGLGAQGAPPPPSTKVPETGQGVPPKFRDAFDEVAARATLPPVLEGDELERAKARARGEGE